MRRTPGLTRTNFGIDIPPGKFMIHSNVNVEDINKDYGVDIGLVGDARLTLELMIDEVNVNEVQEIGPAIAEAQVANTEGKVCVIEVATRHDTRFSKYEDLLKGGLGRPTN